MPNAEKVNSVATIEQSSKVALSDAITVLYTHGVLTCAERDSARKRLATVKQSLTVAADVKEHLATEPVSPPYKFGPLPWIVTMSESGGCRFLIDSRDPENRDMFSGFKINAHGKIGEKSLTTGDGGRYNYHRSYFIEELPE